MWLLAVLIGDCINGAFYQEMYGYFAGLTKTGSNNEATKGGGSAVLLRRLYLHLNLCFCSSHHLQLKNTNLSKEGDIKGQL